MTTKPTIEIVALRHLVEEQPDLSLIGRYSSKNDANPHYEQAFKRDDAGRYDYEYFIAYGRAKRAKFNYERMRAYNRGDWCMLGIRAEAKILINGQYQTITSAGLWGVESDGGKDYIKEIENQELFDLKEQLKAIGLDLPTDFPITKEDEYS